MLAYGISKVESAWKGNIISTVLVLRDHSLGADLRSWSNFFHQTLAIARTIKSIAVLESTH